MANQPAYFPGTATESLESGGPAITRLCIKAASLDRFGMGMLRLGLVIVLGWIGGLKFVSYEADGIVPLVANSPLMRFLYHHPAPEYRGHMNKEGQVVPANQQWNESSGTYPVSYGLGVVIVSLGVMIALYPIWPQVSAVGSFLLILMALTTLSFLVTTPEVWVPALGDRHHGFPYLSGAGPARCEGLHHAGCRCADDGRRGEDLSEALRLIRRALGKGRTERWAPAVVSFADSARTWFLRNP